MKEYAHKGAKAQRGTGITTHAMTHRTFGSRHRDPSANSKPAGSPSHPGVLARGIYLIFIAVLLFTGCSSMVQKSGELLEGSAFEEMNLALYRSGGINSGGKISGEESSGKKSRKEKIELRELRNKNGNLVLEITNNAWPGFILCGSMPGGSGSFELNEARILSSHVNGWNELTLDIKGRAVFDNPKKTGGTLYIPGEVERIQISAGKIRLKGNRLTGTAALIPLRNRRERIMALTEWMAEWLGKNGTTAVFSSQKEFAAFWKSRLFPELVSPKKRLPEYSRKNAQWARADSIKWNLTYTEYLFPEELRELRNSGALLRDWEEALPWIYMEYSWNDIIVSYDDTALIKIK